MCVCVCVCVCAWWEGGGGRGWTLEAKSVYTGPPKRNDPPQKIQKIHFRSNSNGIICYVLIILIMSSDHTVFDTWLPQSFTIFGIHIQKDHICVLKILQSMSELNRLWKHQNNTAYAECLHLQNVEDEHYIQEEDKSHSSGAV